MGCESEKLQSKDRWRNSVKKEEDNSVSGCSFLICFSSKDKLKVKMREDLTSSWSFGLDMKVFREAVKRSPEVGSTLLKSLMKTISKAKSWVLTGWKVCHYKQQEFGFFFTNCTQFALGVRSHQTGLSNNAESSQAEKIVCNLCVWWFYPFILYSDPH